MNKSFTLLITFFFVCNFYGQDWKWKNPIPSGNRLNCVKFVDSSTVFAIGNYGTIIKSTNSGLNWDIQKSNTNIDLLSISAIDKDTVYISGRDLSVLKTTNGGVTWKKILNGSGDRNNAYIFFVNPEIGYLGGEGMDLYKTMDYGKNWIKLEVSIEFQHVTSIFFTTIDTGYASVGYGTGGIMLKTVDGGISWSIITLPLNEQFSSITFADNKTGYLVGYSGSILKTIDGCENWIIQNEFPSSLTNRNLAYVDFINNDIGYTVGGTDILKTTDGGNKWELIAQSNFELFSISFVDSVRGITVGGDWLYEVSGILITSNGGTNWNETSSTITTKYLDRIKFVNSDTGYAVGGHVSATYSGFVIKTTNAGDSWTTLNTGVNTYWISDISIPDTDTIYMVAWQGQILKSSDAGSTWTEQNSNTSVSLYAVQFLNTRIGYAVGYNGTFIKTNDGGVTWVNKVLPIDKSLYTLYFKDINTGYIPVYDWNIDSTILLITTDGGENWIKKSIGTLRNPRKIYFVNSDTAFIVGDFGGILRTINGGNNWGSSYHQGNDYFDIFFTDNNTGYVVGEDGEISITGDYGNSWTVLNSGTDKQLRSVFFTDENTGFVTGSNGVILKTFNSGSSLKSLNQPFHHICQGDSVILKPNVIGGKKPLSYSWDNFQTSSSISVIPEDNNTFTVTITDSELDSIIVKITVLVTSVPTPEIIQNGDTLISNIVYGNQWYRNDTLIVGATSNKLVVDLDGNYYSIVSDYQCFSEKSNIIQVEFSSVIDLYYNFFKIYPNPASSILSIELNNHFSNGHLKVFDINGQELITRKITENVIELNLKDISKGFYLVQIITNDKIMTEKFIKK